MPPPTRTQTGDYHYHVYDYGGAQAWVPTNVGRLNDPTYSMAKDLKGLLDYGKSKNVPRIKLLNLGNVTADGQTTSTLALRFGGADLRRNNYPIVLMAGGVHAREWIAPEIVYLIAEYLVRNYLPKNAKNRVSYAKALSDLVDNRDLIFIPLLNPAGNRFTVFDVNAASRDWRKNRRLLSMQAKRWRSQLRAAGAPFQNINVTGASTFSYDIQIYNTHPVRYHTQAVNLNPQVTGVDLNRNYDTPSWGNVTDPNDAESDPRNDTFFGPGRTSEVELQNLVGLLTRNLAASIDYHSFTKAILYTTEPDGTGQPRQRDLGLCLQRLIATGPRWSFTYDYELGTDMTVLKYEAVGSGADYMASRRNSAAVTIELDPSGANPGFELPPNQIQGVFEKNIRGALGFIAGAAGNLTVTAGSYYFYRHDIQSVAVSRFLNWKVWGRGNRLPI